MKIYRLQGRTFLKSKLFSRGVKVVRYVGGRRLKSVYTREYPSQFVYELKRQSTNPISPIASGVTALENVVANVAPKVLHSQTTIR
jgi:hypothetical protein